MNGNQKIKMCIDLDMAAALPILMCYSLVGETAHEIVGVAMFCLFIAHHIMNIGWIKGLFKGKYTLRRAVGTADNALVFIDNSASVIIAVLKYLCVMVFFVEVGYWVNKAVMKKTKKI